jgi:hypothetical protein
LKKVEKLLCGPKSPASSFMDIMCHVRETEAWDGYPGATRFILALLGNLDLASKAENPCPSGLPASDLLSPSRIGRSASMSLGAHLNPSQPPSLITEAIAFMSL